CQKRTGVRRPDMATASRAPSALFDGDASREGVLATPLIFHVLAEYGHILLPISCGIAQQQHRRSLHPNFHCLRAFRRFRRSAKAFPFDRPSTTFWPT
ncbi:MAG: hypothetical protein ACJ8BE_04605, partial [Microvirga sp.]